MKKFTAALAGTALALVSITASAGAGAEAEAADPLGLAGTWDVRATGDEGGRDFRWEFSTGEGSLAGVSVDDERGTRRAFDRITVSGETVKIEMDVERDGNTGVVAAEIDRKNPRRLEGKWSVTGSDGTVYMSGELTADKQPDAASLAGEWLSVATLASGEELKSPLTLEVVDGGLTGAFQRDDGGTLDIDKVALDGGEVRLGFVVEIEGSPVDTAIEAEADGDGALDGRWVLYDADGNEAMTGDWSASRAGPDFSGGWDVTATVPEEPDYKGTLTLERSGNSYSGTATSSGGQQLDVTGVEVVGSEIDLTFSTEVDGRAVTIVVEAALDEDGKLAGDWRVTDDDHVSGDWGAVRQESGTAGG